MIHIHVYVIAYGLCNVLEQSVIILNGTYRQVDRQYKHKKENWISTGNLHSIKYRDKLYRKLKQTAPTDAAFSILSVYLSAYKKILNKTIRNAKDRTMQICLKNQKLALRTHGLL